MEYFDFYKEYYGKNLPDLGLCCCFSADENLTMLSPTREDFSQLSIEGKAIGFWGSGVSTWDTNKYYSFTPLRQTIVLFMAAMNNEL
jgi:hypothetical protein